MKITKYLIGILAFALVVAVAWMYGVYVAWCASTIWSWYAVPAGIRPVSTGMFFGLYCVYSLFSNGMGVRLMSATRVPEEQYGSLASGLILGPIAILGFAWVGTLWLL